MAGGGGAGGGRILLGAEPPGAGVEVVPAVAELGQGQALIREGLRQGGQDPVGARAQRVQLGVDGQAQHVGEPEQLGGELAARPGEDRALLRLLAELVVEGDHGGSGGRGRVGAHGPRRPQGPVDGALPQPGAAELVADLPGVGLGQAGHQGLHPPVPVLVAEVRHHLGVADLHQGERPGVVQGGDGPPPGVQLVRVRGVVDDDSGRCAPLALADAGGPGDLGGVGRLGEGDADERVGRRERPAGLVEGELGAGRRLQGLGPARGALGRVGGRRAGVQGGGGAVPQGLHLGARRRPEGVQARLLALVQGAGGELGQGVAARAGDVRHEGGVAVARGPRQRQGRGAAPRQVDGGAGLVVLVQGRVGQDLQGAGVQELVVPAVLPRAVGLDAAKAVEVEQGAGRIDDVEAGDARARLVLIGRGPLIGRARRHDGGRGSRGGGAGRPGQDMTPADPARVVRRVHRVRHSSSCPCPGGRTRPPGRSLNPGRSPERRCIRPP